MIRAITPPYEGYQDVSLARLKRCRKRPEQLPSCGSIMRRMRVQRQRRPWIPQIRRAAVSFLQEIRIPEPDELIQQTVGRVAGVIEEAFARQTKRLLGLTPRAVQGTIGWEWFAVRCIDPHERHRT